MCPIVMRYTSRMSFLIGFNGTFLLHYSISLDVLIHNARSEPGMPLNMGARISCIFRRGWMNAGKLKKILLDSLS